MERMYRDQIDIRQHNTLMLLDILKKNRPISRADLAKESQMSATSITRIITDLLEFGLIRETELSSSGIGRKAIMLDIVPSGLYTIGVQIEKHQIRICLLDFEEKIIDSVQCNYDCSGHTSEECARVCLEHFYHIALANRIDLSRVVGIGVGVVGVIDPEAGTVIISPQLDWHNEPVKAAFEKIFDRKVLIDNDAKMLLIGRKRLLNIPAEVDTALLQLGSGVGSAASSSGNIVRGKQNAAGEIGHIIVDQKEGMLCECGRHGCLQTHVAIGHLITRAQKYDQSVRTVAEIHEAYNAGKQWAMDLVEDCMEHILNSLEILSSVYNPSQTIITGALMQEFREFFPEMIQKYKERVMVPQITENEIILSDPDVQDCVLGSALMAMDTFLSEYVMESLLSVRQPSEEN